jgi:arylsulfatase B
MYSNVENTSRRTYLGMVTAMDDMIGNITKELKNSGLYDNSVIIFFSDNGGSDNGGASNLPLKGDKGTFYEGGIRTPAFIHAPKFLKKSG